MDKTNDATPSVHEIDTTGTEHDRDPYAGQTGPVEIVTNARNFEASFKLLIAHLVSKGYGHAAIKRILKGEDVR